MLPEATAPKFTGEVKNSLAKIFIFGALSVFTRLFSGKALPGFQALADLPKGVERNDVSMNFPVVVERELRSSQSVGLNQVET